MKRIAIILMLLCSIFNLHAQPSPRNNYIDVEGYAEKEVIPDEIYINITLLERFEGRDKITIEQQEGSLKQSIKSLGIPMTDLSLSNAEASYIRIKWNNKDVIARKDYLLKVSDAETVGRVFKELDRLNIKNANVTRYEYSKEKELKKQLRISAVKDAKEMAEYMTAAIGQTIGKPFSIRETENYHLPVGALASPAMKDEEVREGEKQQASSDFLEFKKIKYSITISASFEIK